TVQRDAAGTSPVTTSYAYQYFTSTNRVQQVTATPAVASPPSTVTVNDSRGRVIWQKDQLGFITYTQYDEATGGVAKSIADVTIALTGGFTGLPSGWSTPAGGGLHRRGLAELDPEGRVTKATAPDGRIDYTVYNDLTKEARTYPAWDAGANAPTGPTVVTR